MSPEMIKEIFDFGHIDPNTSIGKVLIQSLIGICLVLVVLAVIIAILALLSTVFKYNLIEKATAAVGNFFRRLFGRAPKTKELPAPSAPVAAAPAPIAASVSDDETVAAITAALALVLVDGEGKPVPFVIRKIRHL